MSGLANTDGKHRTRRNAEAATEPDRAGEQDRLLQILAKTAEAFASVLNSQTEIVVHDLTRPENSITTILNGHVSGRVVNQSLLAVPSDDQAFTEMMRRRDDVEPHAAMVMGNYVSHARDGRALRSGSVVFYDGERAPVAALCVNVNQSACDQALTQLRALLAPAGGDETPGELQQAPATMEELVHEIMEQAIAASTAVDGRMTKQEKLAAVSAMHARGLFVIRGSVERVAQRLGTTKFTIYNYLDELGLK